jgi:hypothetical protein
VSEREEERRGKKRREDEITRCPKRTKICDERNC